MELLTGFQPVLPENPKILILGSMPSVVSLEKSEYYGFPHNRFWKIMSSYSHTVFESYDDKLNFLDNKGIALWDVIYSCERVGSLDSKIRNVTCNSIDELLSEYPSITHIVCNGKKAYTLLLKYFPSLDVEVLSLGSTSNANRSVSERELFDEWETTLQTLLGE